MSPSSEIELGAANPTGQAWQGISEPLEANLLVLWPDDEPPILIVSVDFLYAGRIVRSVIERAASATVAPERIFLAATHTHRAPMTDDTKPALGRIDEGYMAWLSDSLRAAVSDVLEPSAAEVVTIAAAKGQARHSINRRLRKKFHLARRPLWNAVVNAPNPAGATDETVISISLRRADGTLLSLLWNYACHPVGYPVRNTVAAHFPHTVRESIRSEAGDSRFPVLYFQGFSGNTRPRATAKVHTLGRFLRRLVSGPLFEDMTKRSYERWSQSLARVVADTIASEEPVAVSYTTTVRASRSAAEFGFPIGDPITFHGIHLGNDLSIIGVSGEVVAEYAPELRQLNSAKYTFCVGCIDHAFGYIPTSQILREGGYEGGGYCRSFGLEELNSDIEANTISGFRAVVASPAAAIVS